MKKCSRCHEIKDDTNFKKEPRNKSGLKSSCRQCDAVMTRVWKDKNKERVSASRKTWYRNHRETELQNAKAFSLQWRYGINPEEYTDMLISQKGVCKICGNPPSDKFSLCVDHNHETGKVRGLLCGSCNFVLGHAKDDPGLLRKAAQYLEEA